MTDVTELILSRLEGRFEEVNQEEKREINKTLKEMSRRFGNEIIEQARQEVIK